MKLILLSLIGLMAVNSSTPEKVYIVPIYGAIDPSNRAFLRRVIDKIKKDKPTLVVFEISTPGGDVGSMEAMSQMILDLRHDIKTCAFITSSRGKDEYTASTAWSAGSLIAMSCQRIFMEQVSVIGAAQPMYMTQEGMRPAERKIIGALSVQFGAIAESNGYPKNLAVAMVDPDYEVFKVTVEGEEKMRFLTRDEIEELRQKHKNIKESLVTTKGTPLSLDAKKAAEYGLATIVKNRSDLYKHYSVVDPVEVEESYTWSEDLVRYVTSPVVTSILLLIGFLAIYMEFRSPGIGYPTVIAVVCLGLVLFGHHLAGLAQVPQIIMIICGLVLVAFEFFVLPGTMIFLTVGLGLVLVGFIMSIQGFAIPDVRSPIQVDTFLASTLRVLVPFLVSTFLFIIIIKIMPGVPVLNRMVLQGELAGSPATNHQFPPDIVSKEGVALSMLRPAGNIEVDKQVYDAVTEGEFIDKGERIIVKAVEGNRIIVKKA